MTLILQSIHQGRRNATLRKHKWFIKGMTSLFPGDEQNTKLVRQNTKLVRQNTKLERQNHKLIRQSAKLVRQNTKYDKTPN